MHGIVIVCANEYIYIYICTRNMSIPQTAVLALNQADNERPECLADFWTAYTWSFSDFSVLVSEIELDCSTLPLKQTGTSFTCKLDGYCILWPYLLIMCIIYIYTNITYIYNIHTHIGDYIYTLANMAWF